MDIGTDVSTAVGNPNKIIIIKVNSFHTSFVIKNSLVGISSDENARTIYKKNVNRFFFIFSFIYTIKNFYYLITLYTYAYLVFTNFNYRRSGVILMIIRYFVSNIRSNKNIFIRNTSKGQFSTFM